MQTALYLTTAYSNVITALLALGLLAFASTHRHAALAIDAALLSLYAARPMPGTLMLFAVLWLIRWSATLATQAAALLGYPWHGLTATAGALLLPGVQPQQRAPRELPPVVTTGKTIALASEAHARPMAPVEWMRACNDDPTVPHLGVIGPTQLGKTTFTLAIAGRRLGELVITTTKDDAWAGGAVTRPTIKLDQNKGIVDWAPVIMAIGSVHFEMLRRNVEHDTGATPLTLIIDEFTTTLGYVPAETKRQILEIWSMGASCGVRTIVIAQEVNARAWGLEGRRDILSNLQFARVAPGRLWALGRLDPNGGLEGARPLDTGGLVALAGEARLAGRGWGGGVPVGAPPTGSAGNGTENAGTGTTIERLMELRAAGLTRDQARAIGCAFRDLDWTEAGNRLGNGIN